MLPLLARIADEPVPDLRGRGVPAGVGAAIESAMAKAPEDRPPSAAAFGEALRDAQVTEGLTPTPLPLSGRESVAAAHRVATAPTDPHDPNATIARSRPRSDDNRTVANRAAEPPAPAPPPDPARPKRRRRVLLAVTAVVLVLAVGVAAALALGGGDDGGGTTESPEAAGDGGAPSGATLDEMATDVIDLTNDHRADVGVDPVSVDPQLAREAMRHATLAAEVEGYPEANLTAISNRHEGRWGTILVNTISGPDVESAFEGMLQTRLTRENLGRPPWPASGWPTPRTGPRCTSSRCWPIACRADATPDHGAW